ncbi:carbonic anhydrase [Chromobacterium sp. IIBBL 290-4]|uniref:carbonic anhydrase n=1 Tax=Chromobacterium sp. IIBBL 290-4 TaxID=2953890 RepID=UPI0020B8B375|nr:carbonic anhydrase [Chromobacterium sp. IIBBL 290-4]UTH74919.1 hypothetical protein NKT35_02090 [Chromobacterium sp. IIBBL 290-4]
MGWWLAAAWLLPALQQAWAEDAPPADSQVQQVIKLPLKVAKPPEQAPAAEGAATPKSPEMAKPKGKEAKGKEAKPAAAKSEAASSGAGKEAKPAAQPEKLEPSVSMGKPPGRDLSQPSPEVHAPGGKSALAHHAKTRHVAKAAHGKAGGESAEVRNVVANILKANSASINKRNPGHFAKLGERASPKATVVACSSPGGQVGMAGGDADLFVISNLGNQLASSEGSIEYGVRNLHTPLLMFVSHTGCGAIKAAAGDYSDLGPAVQKELDNIEIPKGIDATNGALININNQVEGAILKFSGEVEAGKLAVLGGYYDYNNDLKQGRGKLVITNINGETDPARIRELTRSGRYFHYGFMGR